MFSYACDLPLSLVAISQPEVPVLPASYCGSCWTSACFALPPFIKEPKENVVFEEFLGMCPTLVVKKETLCLIARCIALHVKNLSRWAEERLPLNKENSSFYKIAQIKAIEGLEDLLHRGSLSGGGQQSFVEVLSTANLLCEILRVFREALADCCWILSEGCDSLIPTSSAVLCQNDGARDLVTPLPSYLTRFYDVFKWIGCLSQEDYNLYSSSFFSL